MKTKLFLIGIVICLVFLVNGTFAEEQKKSEKNTSTSSEQVKQKASEQKLVEKKKSDPLAVKAAKKQKKNQEGCKDQIKVKVKGMVCDYCVGALEKVFKKQPGYKSLKVDLDAGHMVLFMQPEKTLEEKIIKKLVKNAGYDAKSIHKGCDS